MVAAVNAIFSQVPRAFLLEGIQFRPVSARPNAVDALWCATEPEPSGLDVLFVDSDPEAGRSPR
jgi:hypothetical protein